MLIKVDAVYEKGVLRLQEPLPFEDGKKVRVSISEPVNWEESYGLCGFKGTVEEAEFFASDPELDYPPPPEES